jgi:putative ABC transport system permease protein
MMKEIKPPRLLEKTLQHILPRYVGETALGDFEEEYEYLVQTRGNIHANLWYFIQILKSIPAFIGNFFRWGIVMFQNYMKVTLRTIRRHKGFSFINILGLAVGMACVIIILLWVRYEMSFDTYHEKAKGIFRVAIGNEPEGKTTQRKVVVTPPALSPALLADFPEISASARLSRGGGEKLFSYGDKNFLESCYAVDPSFFVIFTFDFLEGNESAVFSDPYSIVLSETMAKKFFGKQDPMGKIIQFDQKADFTVTGIIREIPSNSHLQKDIFIPFETMGKLYEEPLEHWKYMSFYTYILLDPDVDPLTVEAKFPAFTKKYGIPEASLFLQPLLSIHLHSHYIGEISPNTHISTLLLLGSIAVLILLIACINYMNLTTARTSARMKEVGTRKVIGAYRSQIARQFVGESIIMALFSLILSLFLAYLSLPFFNALADRQLALNGQSFVQILPGILVLVLFVGFFAGSYPALFLSSLKPIAVLRSEKGRGSQRTWLRNILVVVQFSISLILIISTILVKSQLDFVRKKDMGFDRDQIVVVRLHEPKIRQNVRPVLEELKRRPQIFYAASSMHLPNDVGASTIMEWSGKPDDSKVWVKVSEVGYDFTELYGIEIIKGRSFSKEFPSDENGAFLINESTMKILGDDFRLGMGLSHWGSPEPSGQIVGVMKDFHLNSLHEEIKPLYFYLNPDRGQQLSIKIQGGSIPETIGFIRETMEKFSPHYPFEYRFFDDIFNAAYIKEQKMESMFGAFASIAVFIACMGVFGLSAFLAEQKRKEIGIRKVLGASVSRIFYLLSKDLVRLVLAANIIGWPVAYFAMSRWLQNFAYRTPIGLTTFLLAAMLVLMVSLGTLSYQAIKAALANPVISLRYE